METDRASPIWGTYFVATSRRNRNEFGKVLRVVIVTLLKNHVMFQHRNLLSSLLTVKYAACRVDEMCCWFAENA